MKINDTIRGTFSKLAFTGRVVKVEGGLISVAVDNPCRNLPVGPCMIAGTWGKALTFHINDTNVVLS